MALSRAWFAALAMACTSSPSASATPTSAPPAAPPPSPAAPAPTGRTAAQDAWSEVRLLSEKTSTGGDVFAVGIPRFEMASEKGFGPLALRNRRGTVYAEDDHWVSLWDAATGAPSKRIAPLLKDYPVISTTLAVSADGDMIATGSSHKVRLFQAPFDKAVGELACYDALAFAHNGKQIVCSTTTLAVWDVGKRTLVASLPPSAAKGAPDVAVFAPDDRSIVWTTDYEVLRWDLSAAGAVTSIYKAPDRITHAALAAGGTTAYIAAANKAVIVDLITSKSSPAIARFGTAISPSGKRLAQGTAGAVQVLDVASGQPIWSAKVGTPVSRIAFGDSDDSVVYLEGHRLRVATLPNAPHSTPEPPRFAGWLAPGVAAIEHQGVLRSFDLANRTWGPADRAALAPKGLAGAPTWATWSADAPNGLGVAAEPSKRHELSPAERGLEPCQPKLRVWTKSGGPKTLTMACSKPELEGHEDPGWEMGGGWAVGLSATAAALYDARTGKRVISIPVPPRKNKHPDYAPAYWKAALAPSGDWLALVWRRARLGEADPGAAFDPREDAMHIDETLTNATCMSGQTDCQLEYFVELWSLKGAPKRSWSSRLERLNPERNNLPMPATPSGPLLFHGDGSLLIALDDGDVRVLSPADAASGRTEGVHRSPVVQMSLAPGGLWAFSADRSGAQLVWNFPQANRSKQRSNH